MIKKALSFSLAFVLFMTSAPVSTFAGEEAGAVPAAEETALTAEAEESGEEGSSQYSDEGSADADPEDSVVEEDPEAAEDPLPEEDGLSESLSAADGLIEDPDEPLDVYKNAVEVQPGGEYNDFNQIYKLRIERDGRAILYFNSDLKYFRVPVYTDLTTPDWGSAYEITQWDSFLDMYIGLENGDVAEDGYFYFGFEAYSGSTNNVNISFKVYPQITIVTDSDNIHDGGASEAVEAVYGTTKDFAVDAYVPFGEIRYSWGTKQWDAESRTYVFTPFADDTGNDKYTLSIDQKEDMTLTCRLTALPDGENPAETTVKDYDFEINVTDPAAEAAEAAETLIDIADGADDASADQIVEVLEDAGSAQVLDQLKESLKAEDSVGEDPDALNARLAEVTAKLDERLVGKPVEGQSVSAYVAATEPAAKDGITVEITGAASTAASVIRNQEEGLQADHHYQAAAVINRVEEQGDTLTIDISLNVKDKESDTVVKEGVEPVSPVTVTVSLPANYVGKKLRVTHTLNEETGETEDVSCTLVDDYKKACFTVASLSPFEIKALECGHYHMTYVPEQAATCNAPGNIAYYECDDCHAKFKDEQGMVAASDEEIQIPKTDEHAWDDGVVTTPATMSHEGIRTLTCSVCTETKTETIPKIAGPEEMIKEMAKKIDFAKTKVTVTQDKPGEEGTWAQITVKVPVCDWYTDADMAIVGPSITYGETVTDCILLQGEYSESDEAITLTGQVSLTEFSAAKEYSFNVFDFYLKEDAGLLCRFTAANEESDLEHNSVSYQVTEDVAPLSIGYRGPVTVNETEGTEIPVGIETWFEFKPDRTDDYYFKVLNDGFAFATDGFKDVETADYVPHHLEEGKTYRGSITAFLSQGSTSTDKYVQVKVAQNTTNIIPNEAEAGSDSYALGQVAEATFHVSIEGGDASFWKARAIFVNKAGDDQDYDHKRITLDKWVAVDKNTFRLSGYINPVNTLGTYQLESVEITDTMGKVTTYTYDGEEQVPLCSFKVITADELLQGAPTGDVVAFDTLSPRSDAEIKEGVTVEAKYLSMKGGDATLTVNGTLRVSQNTELKTGVLVLNQDITASGHYLELEGFRVEGSGKIILDDTPGKTRRVKSRDALAHLAGKNVGTVVEVSRGASCDYKWNGLEWVTDHTPLKYVEMQEATCKETGHIEYWVCEGCGLIFTDESKTQELTESDILIPKTNDHIWNDGVVTTLPTKTEPGVKTFTCSACGTTKTESYSLIEDMAKKIDFAKATVEVTPDKTGTCAQITVTIPVHEWFTDPEMSIVGPGMAFAGDVEADIIQLEGEYIKDELVFTATEPLTRISGEKEYRFTVLYFYTEEEGTEPFWRLTAAEEAPSLGDVSYCVGEDAVKPFSVDYTGPVLLSETEWTEIPVGIETWFEFEPSDTGDYYAKIDNGFPFAFDGFMEVVSQKPCPYHLEEGKKYRGSITPYDPAGSTVKSVSAVITQNDTEIDLEEADAGADCYGIGQKATVTLWVHINGETLIKKAEAVFVNRDENEQGSDEKRIKFIDKVAFDDSSICLSGPVNSNNRTGKYELDSVTLIDTRGKVFTYTYGGESPEPPQCSFEVATAEELIEDAPAGDTVEFVALSPRSDVEIPDGVTVKADNLDMKVPNAKMTVNGTLLVGVRTDLQAGVMELNRDITVSGQYLEREGFRVEGNGKVVLDGTPEKTRYRIYDPDALTHLAGSCVNTVVEKADDPDVKYYWCGTEWLSAPVNLLPVAGRDATCKEAGWKSYYECEHCHKKYLEPEGRTELTESDILIPKTSSHKWNAGTVTTPATETAPGVRTYTCTVCGTTRTETIPQLAPQEIITISKKPAKFKAKAGKKGKVTLTWKKLAKKGKTKALFKQVSKIEIQVSTDSGFAPDATKKYVLSKKKAKKNLKLKPKTKYFIRIRYTDGKGGYSNWVKKSVKTKK